MITWFVSLENEGTIKFKKITGQQIPYQIPIVKKQEKNTKRMIFDLYQKSRKKYGYVLAATWSYDEKDIPVQLVYPCFFLY